eukprot:364707-Chlamydomonas_euryale.AAC.2
MPALHSSTTADFSNWMQDCAFFSIVPTSTLSSSVDMPSALISGEAAACVCSVRAQTSTCPELNRSHGRAHMHRMHAYMLACLHGMHMWSASEA